MSELRFVMAPDHAVGRRRVRWTLLNGHPGACRCWHADPSEALACYRGELVTNPNPDPDPDAPGGAGGGRNRAVGR